jgi:hypothetical protein
VAVLEVEAKLYALVVEVLEEEPEEKGSKTFGDNF